ncbi:MAG: cytidylate kinase-like family protein [Clostridia bacterium]|nr:cytidylate kinase-like family protein [Clostridia bacterium]
MSKKANIICISRTYGSNGKGIGKAIAKELGYDFYDKDIMRLASEKTGLVEDYFKSDRAPRSSLLYSLAMGLYSGQGVPIHYNDSLSDDRLFEIQSEIIKEKAEKGNCVFVGRCAGYVLRKFDNVLNIFIDCDIDVRVKKIARRMEMEAGVAKKLIQKTDKKRRVYYEYYTSRSWGNPAHYDLCINTAKVDEDGAVAMIKSMLDLANR